jgi:hypothetical protein
LWHILLAMFTLYLATYLAWAAAWHAVQHSAEDCVRFADDDRSFLSAVLFSIELQVRRPGRWRGRACSHALRLNTL